MKRIVGSLLVIALVLAVVPFATAQGGPAVTGKGGEDRAAAITLSGELDLQMRYANGAYVSGLDIPGVGRGNCDALYGGSPKLTLDLEAKLVDKMSVLAELEVPRVDAGSLVNVFGYSSTDSTGTAIGGSGGLNLGVRQLYIKMDPVITPDLSVTFGIQKVVYDVRGSNNPLILALGRSESAAIKGGVGSINGMDELPAGGLLATYRIGDAGSISFFHMIVSGQLSVKDNEMVTGIDAFYTLKLDEKQLINLGAILTLTNLAFDADNGVAPGEFGSEIWTLGLSAATNNAFVDGLKIWAEVGFNFGTYSDTATPGITVDAGGFMFDIGASYQFDVDWKPCVGVEYLYVSGDDVTGANAGDTYEGFVSYEDNNDLIIVEDKEFGWDIDENYSAVKIRVGAAGDLIPSPVKDAFTADLCLAILSLNEVATGGEDNLGVELDIKLGWAATKQLKVFGGIGVLFGSDVNQALAGGANDTDLAFTFFLGTNVKF